MTLVDPERVHVLGIRHHGPGSARAVRAALDTIRPETVLIEGPPEADALTGLAPDLEPPVALLAYRADSPAQAAFWPFAAFSPEWQALRWAADNGAEADFCDLPAAHTLAEEEPADSGPTTGPEDEDDPERRTRVDPLGVLAEAAGFDDPERWWEDVVEQRDGAGPSPFPAILDAMSAVRGELAPEPWDDREARREAHMRQTLRRAMRAGSGRIAVVCGAWHAPALRDLPPAGHDTALLKGLPKVKTATTWIPWSHGRLAAGSGYRAGVRSPGWYHHLFTAPDRPVERWLTEAARRLRGEDQPVSSAHVIEAVRLTTSLAVLRGRPLAGLAEVAEATTAVLCEGSESRAALVHRSMAIGERLGAVPESTPMVPLQRDLTAQQRSLRLKPEALRRDLVLDLRKDLDRRRSVLLHRLALLGVDWGTPESEDNRSRGTFRETWSLCWEPGLDITLIEASAWGTTVDGAATARAADRAAHAPLPGLTALTEQCLLAELHDAVPAVLDRVAARAAEGADIAHLMAALPPLARSSRYGSVRRLDSDALRRVAVELLRRVCAGLAPAVGALGDDAAAAMVAAVDGVHTAAVQLGGAAEAEWLDTLERLAERGSVPGKLAGRVHRLLRDTGRLSAPTLALRLSRATSAAVPPGRSAAWIEGFLSGSGLLLVHDTDLLTLIDRWLSGLAPQAFTDVLPLLRRSFGAFPQPERRAIGEQAARLGDGAAPERPAEPIDAERAAPALAAAAALLGVGGPAAPG
ncbi:hypothetical protein CLV63_12360 [Murinocardiopsis flavida]|uniref:Uncharacterized protein n=1 Tax=Murinocardiopsis flavida TaxID=645275 RepID=A0A2P8CZ36_9ACTN|nr:DUF5682 family protein [Murinocardiopsis flavida]PSK90231.1 hypothetical protein CLV63_12360 [Murinocardiopsis flavida]